MKVGVIVGSLRRESFNRRFADALVRLGPDDFEFSRSRSTTCRCTTRTTTPKQADTGQRLKRESRHAQGLLFVTPEYNRSVPGVLKNAIDHASRPYGKNAWQASRPA